MDILMHNKVSLVIPAFNEEPTISGIVEAVKQNKYIDEIIVVDDGSSDTTAQRAKNSGATVITLEKNQGKAGAMNQGIKAAHNRIICFLDGDIRGITSEVVAALVLPVLKGECRMFIGILARKSNLANSLLPHLPKLGGCRTIYKELWYAIPDRLKKKYQIEMVLNFYAKKLGHKTEIKIFDELYQEPKEKKWGLFTGLLLRGLMVANIIYIFFRLYFYENIKIIFARLAAKESFS